MSTLLQAVDELMNALCTEQVLMERLDPETRQSEVDYGYESLTDEEISQRAAERRQEIYDKIKEKRSKLKKGYKTPAKARDAVDEVLDGMTDREILLLEPQIGPINKLIDAFESLPDTEDMATAALAGGAKRGWYKDSAQAISEIFGADAPRFVALLAATSPNVTVSDNLRHTSRIWEAWENAGRSRDPDVLQKLFEDYTKEQENRIAKFRDAWKEAGKPTDEEEYRDLAMEVLGDTPASYTVQQIMNRSNKSGENDIAKFLNAQAKGGTYLLARKDAWGENAIRALSHPNPIEMGGDVQTRLTINKNELPAEKPGTKVDKFASNRLGGDKVESFRKNLLGDLQAVTNDTWMAQYGDLYQSFFGNKQNYATFASLTRRTAKRLNRMAGIEEDDPEAWTPAEVQETVWSLFKAMTENVVRRGEKMPSDMDAQALDRTSQLTDADIAGVDDFASNIANDEEVINVLRRVLPDADEKLAAIRSRADAAKDRFEKGEEASTPLERAKAAGLGDRFEEIARRSGGIKLRKKTDNLLEHPTMILSKPQISGQTVKANMRHPVEQHNMRAFLIALKHAVDNGLGNKMKSYQMLVKMPGKDQYAVITPPKVTQKPSKPMDGKWYNITDRIRVNADITKPGPFIVEFTLNEKPMTIESAVPKNKLAGMKEAGITELGALVDADPEALAAAMKRTSVDNVTGWQEKAQAILDGASPYMFKPHAESMKRWKASDSTKKKSIRMMFKKAIGADNQTNQILDRMVKENPESFAGLQPSTVEGARRGSKEYKAAAKSAKAKGKKMSTGVTDDERYDMDRDWLEANDPKTLSTWDKKRQSGEALGVEDDGVVDPDEVEDDQIKESVKPGLMNSVFMQGHLPL